MSTRSILEGQLNDIRTALLQLGTLVEHAISQAVTALQTRDAGLAQQIIDDDRILNDLRDKVEDECLHVFATQQPMARDLRALVAAITIATELERMGDHAEGMSKMLVHDGVDAVGELVIDLPHMADVCRQMVRAAMEAFHEEDVDKARQTAAMDDTLDGIYKKMFDDIIDHMARGDLTVGQGTYLLWAAHNLERIGDRVTNICERVEFASTGTLRNLNPPQQP